MTGAFALECSGLFLSEYRTELYKWYCSGETQAKNVLSAKNAWQGRALLGFERHGA